MRKQIPGVGLNLDVLNLVGERSVGNWSRYEIPFKPKPGSPPVRFKPVARATTDQSTRQSPSHTLPTSPSRMRELLRELSTAPSCRLLNGFLRAPVISWTIDTKNYEARKSRLLKYLLPQTAREIGASLDH